MSVSLKTPLHHQRGFAIMAVKIISFYLLPMEAYMIRTKRLDLFTWRVEVWTDEKTSIQLACHLNSVFVGGSHGIYYTIFVVTEDMLEDMINNGCVHDDEFLDFAVEIVRQCKAGSATI